MRQFPTNLTAMIFKMDVKPNFTVENEAAISAPPKVDFGKRAGGAGGPPPAHRRGAGAPAGAAADAATPRRTAERRATDGGATARGAMLAEEGATEPPHARMARAACAASVAAALWSRGGSAAAQAWEAGTDGLAADPAAARARHRSHAARCPRPNSRRSKRSSPTGKRDVGNQLAVLMVPTTQPEPIEAYSIRVADAWKIGRKGQDNGALFLVAKNDRKMRIEVGYGLEGVLTDVTSRPHHRARTSRRCSARASSPRASTPASTAIIAVVGKGEPLPPREAKPRAAARRRIRLRDAADPAVRRRAGRSAASCARIFGKVGGSTVGGGVVGAVAWFVAGSILIGDRRRRSSLSS